MFALCGQPCPIVFHICRVLPGDCPSCASWCTCAEKQWGCSLCPHLPVAGAAACAPEQLPCHHFPPALYLSIISLPLTVLGTARCLKFGAVGGEKGVFCSNGLSSEIGKLSVCSCTSKPFTFFPLVCPFLIAFFFLLICLSSLFMLGSFI